MTGENEMGKAFDEIHTGLLDALDHAKGNKSGVLEHKPTSIDARAIREKTGMSQRRFCAIFGISLGTLRHWEQGLRTPRGRVVDKNPQAVIEAVTE